MPKYCAFLGHQPQISIAELTVMIPGFKPLKSWDNQIITFEADVELHSDWLSILGGTILIAQEIPPPKAFEGKRKIDLETAVPLMLHSELKGVKRKATFSLRCLNVPRTSIRSLYKTCKTLLKEKGMPSRYIGNERHPAKPGTLMLRGIPGENSAEIVILQSKDHKQTWIGKTCAVQNIEQYTDRDMNKPYRDTHVGLLPPKLAQIMINLSLQALPNRTKLTEDKDAWKTMWKEITVWDPFCGSGVIMIEALLRRCHIIGSDKSKKAVEGCTENIDWLRNKEKTPKAISHHIFQANATKKVELPRKPHVIVTETTLGPGLSNFPTKKDLAKLVKDAEEIELGFFENVSNLTPEIPILCTFPVYFAKDGTEYPLTKVIEKIEKLGYRRTFVKNKFINLTERMSLLYHRPDQFVGREIFCFMPTKK